MNRNPNEAGFTLIELIVSLTVLALLTAALGFSIRFGLQAWRGAEANVAFAENLQRTQSFLRSEIEGAYPLVVASGMTDLHIEFTGGKTEMEFLGPAPLALAPAGRARIKLAGEASGAKRDLVMSAQMELAAGPSEQKSETLLSGLRSLEFSYFGGKPAAWHDTWKDSMRLPELVRIRCEFADARVWPDLVVATRIQADVGCRLDPLTHDCRGRQ